jgi:MFS transporter, DHA2 family, multidrug resistance protein
MAMFLLGFVLYATTVLIPQLLQELLGYTARLAGLALSPGGAVIMLMMPVVGFLVSKVDTRLLIAFGCIVSASALFVMAGWNLGLDYGHAVRARMLQSFGLAFLFIPINVAAFAYVPKEKTNMGTGFINLARNIGASVGIATVTTMLSRRTQLHLARLTERVNDLSLAYHNTLHGMQMKLVHAGSTMANATSQAHGMIYNTVVRQATMLSFLDDFKMLGIVLLGVLPVLMLAKKPRAQAGAAPVH